MMSRLRALFIGVVIVASIAHAGTAADSQIDLRQVRLDLQSNPGDTVDRLKGAVLATLLDHQQYGAVEELAVAGTLALPADTWRIEELQRYRIRALLAEHRSVDALHAAKALFNVCSMGFVKDALPLLSQALSAAHPNDPEIVPRFKLQVMAGASEDPAERQRLLEKYGGNTIMTSIAAEPDPYRVALEQRKNLTGWREQYGNGNLLLLSGRFAEARVVFTKVYTERPPEELRYASEAVAKLIKAEDGQLGRANQFVRSIRPQP
jgi:hypothetical protein